MRSADPAGGGPVEGLLRQHAATAETAVRELLTLDDPAAPFIRDLSMPAHALGSTAAGGRFLRRYGFNPAFAPWIRARGPDYDAVVVHGLWNYASLSAARVLPDSGVPYFVFPHGMMDPWFRRAHPLKHLGKQVTWLLGEGRLLARARAVFFTSEDERRLARGMFPGEGYDEMVVPYGTGRPPARTAAQVEAFGKAAPEVGDRRFLLFLGRLHPKKGCDLLLESFAALQSLDPDLHLVMAGPGEPDYAAQLKGTAAATRAAGRIHWTGPLYGDAKWGALRQAEALVLPSHQENFGIAVAEALGCGAPVLISDKVNTWREIAEAGAGLIEPDDLAGTESLLRRWLETPPAQRRAMGAAAETLFAAKFDVAEAAPALLGIIRSRL